MGITGLLPLLKPASRPAHIRELEGKRVAVDTYCWLHKGAYAASRELCLGIPTGRHVDYCMQRIALFHNHGVTPVLVFDGGHLPSKAGEEEKRKRSREENMVKALEHERGGNRSAAMELFQRSVDITPAIAFQLIQVLKQKEVEFVVAPYEADAQLAYLCRTGAVDAVVTEDSDLIAYGCPRVLFKMDKFGAAVEIRLSDIPSIRDPSFSSFTPQMVMEMCIMSGCDYVQSLPGVGLKKAHGLIHRFKSFQKAVKALRFNGTQIPPGFEDSVTRAILTFKHQRVYDPATKQLVHLEPTPEDLAGHDLAFLGPDLDHGIARKIAEGELDPITLKPLAELMYSPQQSFSDASPHPSAKPDPQTTGGIQFLDRKRRQAASPLPVQKNKLSKYFVPSSLEAKRQFQVPRSTPPQTAGDQGSNRPTPPHPPLGDAPPAECAKKLSINQAEESGTCRGGTVKRPGFAPSASQVGGRGEVRQGPRGDASMDVKTPAHAGKHSDRCKEPQDTAVAAHGVTANETDVLSPSRDSLPGNQAENPFQSFSRSGSDRGAVGGEAWPTSSLLETCIEDEDRATADRGPTQALSIDGSGSPSTQTLCQQNPFNRFSQSGVTQSRGIRPWAVPRTKGQVEAGTRGLPQGRVPKRESSPMLLPRGRSPAATPRHGSAEGSPKWAKFSWQESGRGRGSRSSLGGERVKLRSWLLSSRKGQSPSPSGSRDVCATEDVDKWDQDVREPPARQLLDLDDVTVATARPGRASQSAWGEGGALMEGFGILGGDLEPTGLVRASSGSRGTGIGKYSSECRSPPFQFLDEEERLAEGHEISLSPRQQGPDSLMFDREHSAELMTQRQTDREASPATTMQANLDDQCRSFHRGMSEGEFEARVSLSSGCDLQDGGPSVSIRPSQPYLEDLDINCQESLTKSASRSRRSNRTVTVEDSLGAYGPSSEEEVWTPDSCSEYTARHLSSAGWGSSAQAEPTSRVTSASTRLGGSLRVQELMEGQVFVADALDPVETGMDFYQRSMGSPDSPGQSLGEMAAAAVREDNASQLEAALGLGEERGTQLFDPMCSDPVPRARCGSEGCPSPGLSGACALSLEISEDTNTSSPEDPMLSFMSRSSDADDFSLTRPGGGRGSGEDLLGSPARGWPGSSAPSSPKWHGSRASRSPPCSPSKEHASSPGSFRDHVFLERDSAGLDNCQAAVCGREGNLSAEGPDPLALSDAQQQTLRIIRTVASPGSPSGCKRVCAPLARHLGEGSRAGRIEHTHHSRMHSVDRGESDGCCSHSQEGVAAPADDLLSAVRKLKREAKAEAAGMRLRNASKFFASSIEHRSEAKKAKVLSMMREASSDEKRQEDAGAEKENARDHGPANPLADLQGNVKTAAQACQRDPRAPLATDMRHIEQFAAAGHSALDRFEARLRRFKHAHDV